MKYRIRNEVHIICWVFLLIIAVTMTVFIDYKKKKELDDKIDFDEIINDVIAENAYNKENTTYTIIGNKYISIIDKTNINPVGTIRDIKNGEVSIDKVLKEDKVNDFNDLVSFVVRQKYPEFITNTILGEDKRSYEVSDTKITIYFSNESINPSYDKRLSIDLGCPVIKDFLNYECQGTVEFPNEVDSLDKVVALTFDDGPTKNKTDKVVEILNKNKANATFFMVGNKISYQNKPTILNVLNNGNEIGSHSYSHKMFTRMKDEEILEELTNTNNNFKEITGEDLYLVRPPYGSSNQRVRSTVENPFILWSIDTLDWHSKDALKVYEEVISKVEDGDIILMHDSYDSTLAALEEVLPKLYTMGYKVTTVSNLAKFKNQEIAKNTTYHFFR